ncbi:hypothetical protein GCM10008961_02200 [Deinococcus knuensis]|uniref:Uncharacterized protein n=1 Tax=Deinococcus knuensis TaxID=1837380 RepID=A0ABQ2SAD4_9DEIO|nr:hypothetical protein GCM10008961_02200 [Deinococcus knuensis]
MNGGRVRRVFLRFQTGKVCRAARATIGEGEDLEDPLLTPWPLHRGVQVEARAAPLELGGPGGPGNRHPMVIVARNLGRWGRAVRPGSGPVGGQGATVTIWGKVAPCPCPHDLGNDLPPSAK